MRRASSGPILAYRLVLAAPLLIYSFATINFIVLAIPHGRAAAAIWLLAAPLADTPWLRRILLRLGRGAHKPRADQAVAIGTILNRIKPHLTVHGRRLTVLVVDDQTVWAETYGAHCLVVSTGLLTAATDPRRAETTDGYLAGLLQRIDCANRWSPFLDWATLPCLPMVTIIQVVWVYLCCVTPGARTLMQFWWAACAIGSWFVPMSDTIPHLWLLRLVMCGVFLALLAWPRLRRWVEARERAAQQAAAAQAGYHIPRPAPQTPAYRFTL